ncbi:MAG TPA: nucleoside triphosphate pyrophosphohydrolase family protein [Gemmatimonadaceae bacterium]|nr:nucleoside triphosphate pyrophosphohydrolase family protein [Gemmatimonadaceae bacterium]
MTLDEFEAAASRTKNPKLSDRERLLDAAAGLAEESGEIVGLVRKHLFQSHPLDRDKLQKELGDALWCLAITAQSAGLSLEQVAAANVAKLRARYPEGYTDDKSVNRTSDGPDRR